MTISVGTIMAFEIQTESLGEDAWERPKIIYSGLQKLQSV
jgi:hypothetical protein